MTLTRLAPVFRRELRLARRQNPNWRTNWKWLAGGVAWCAFVVVFLRLPGMNPINLVQFVGGFAGALTAMMPLGFATDRQAGQQSLLRLTGLGPLDVFAASVAGSLYVVLELWLFCVPLMLGSLAFLRTRPGPALLLISVLGAMAVWLASLRIFGAASARTRSVAVLLATLAGACLVIPAVLDVWLGNRMGPGLGQILHVLGDADHWLALRNVGQQSHQTGALWAVLVRLLAWSALWLGLAAWVFRRDWLRAESGMAPPPWWQRWLRARLDAPSRRVAEDATGRVAAYLARFPQPEGWCRVQWGVAAVLAVSGVGLTFGWSWHALPCALTLGVALVDMMAHVAVSGPVAEDRRDGAFELLFTTPLGPNEVLAAADRAGREVVQAACVPGLFLLGVFAVTAGWRIPPTLGPGGSDWLIAVSFCAWPLVYAAGLGYLGFELPAGHAANTGEPFHAFSLPVTAWMMPVLVGLGAWAFTDGSPHVQIGVAIAGPLVLVIWLVVREQFAAERGLSEDDFRLVAAAPLPTEESIPADRRTATPWVPKDFRR